MRIPNAIPLSRRPQPTPIARRAHRPVRTSIAQSMFGNRRRTAHRRPRDVVARFAHLIAARRR
jgi:hypothetical protein